MKERKKQAISKELQRQWTKARIALVVLAKSRPRTPDHPDVQRTLDTVWDALLSAYGLGMDETIIRLTPPHLLATKPPMVEEQVELEESTDGLD